MPLPWEPGGIAQVIRLFQLLYIDHYPIHYKPCLQWVVCKDVYKLESVTHRHPRITTVMKLSSSFVNGFTAFSSLCCIFILPKEYLSSNTVIWKDIRLWAYICGGGTAGILSYAILMLVLGDEATIISAVNQVMNMDLNMRQGNKLLQSILHFC